MVDVRFINADSGESLGQTRMDPEQLPESFHQATTLTLAGAEWTVRSAEPPTRAEFAAAGQLVLKLAKAAVQYVDPREVLYSLPTLNDELPPEEGSIDGTEIVLHEDDWRQVELVHWSHQEIVVAELEAIHAIYREQRQGSGFKEIHLRERLPQPLAGTRIDWSELAPLVSDGYQPLSFEDHEHRVQGGFAIQRPTGSVICGTCEGSTVTVLCLGRGWLKPDAEACAAIEALAAKHQLMLVNWVRCAATGPGDADLFDFDAE
jgi:hypothetical protein